MRERPILFSDEMVRAILANRKSQTRRVAKFKPYTKGATLNLNFSGLDLGFYCTGEPKSGYVLRSRGGGGCWNDRTQPLHCPYGKVGDRLWVKEAWTPDHAAFYPCFPIVYRADFGQPYDRNERCEVYSPEQKAWYPFRWRPSIFMQRHRSRLLLEILATRIERLQAISESDAMAEGLIEWTDPPRVESKHYGLTCADVWETSAAKAYARLWDSINAKPKHIRRRKAKDKPTDQYDSKHPSKPDISWAANPFVWVIEFKRVESEVTNASA